MDNEIPRMLVTIEKLDNGYIINGPDNYQVVAEQRPSDDCLCEALIDGLFSVLEGLGCLGSKHSHCRVKISCKCCESEE